MEEIDAIDNGISTHDGEPRYQVQKAIVSYMLHSRFIDGEEAV